MPQVNYNDWRFQQVENEKNNELNQTNNTYDQMINKSSDYYDKQIQASKDYANKQNELQQAQTDFAVEKVNQQKDQTRKDYEKEQKGAFTDYQKAVNPYGVQAEKEASQGLTNSGYSETTKTNMFNTYQNRYVAARDSYQKAVLNYDNSIKEAQLANNSAMAKIAYEALQQQLQLSLQGFEYNNNLVLQKMQAVNSTNDRYYTRYQGVLSQINTENAQAEQIRQYNETMAFNKQKASQDQANWEKTYALQKASASAKSSKNNNQDNNAILTDGSNSKLSSSAQNLYDKWNNSNSQLKNRTIVGPLMDQDTLKNYTLNTINDAYNNKKISENDVKSLISKMGY